MKNLLFLLLASFTFAQNNPQQIKRAAIAFLNVENLWDTIPSADYIDGTLPKNHLNFHRSVPLDSLQYLPITEEYKGRWGDDLLLGKKVVRKQVLPDDFTPNSPKRYNTKVYRQKLSNEAKVISELGAQYTRTLPAIVGLIEVENRQVIQDLIKQPVLNKTEWGIVHYNSYDARGIDVGLIYQKKRFVLTDSYKKELEIYGEEGKREYTRDILVVKGLLDGEKIAVFMNHWPSRRGGEAASQAKRNFAAKMLKKEMDKIRAEDPETILIAMGDFNDDPVSPSLKNYLKAVADKKDLSDETPYLNLMYKMYKQGIASLGYRDAPNLFDQIIISKNAITEGIQKKYSVLKAEIYAPSYLITSEGAFKGYPFRSWNGDVFTGGYSDHFPAFVILQKEYLP